MQRKWFVLFALLAIATIGVFVTQSVIQAQRPERGERGGGPPGGGGRMNPTGLVENSWAGVAFVVKVDDKTLLKARPVYQKAWDDMNKTIEEARESGGFQGIRERMRAINEEFLAGLKNVLTEDQLNQLQKWQMEQMERQGRGRGGPGGGRRGGGGPPE